MTLSTLCINIILNYIQYVGNKTSFQVIFSLQELRVLRYYATGRDRSLSEVGLNIFLSLEFLSLFISICCLSFSFFLFFPLSLPLSFFLSSSHSHSLFLYLYVCLFISFSISIYLAPALCLLVTASFAVCLSLQYMKVVTMVSTKRKFRT